MYTHTHTHIYQVYSTAMGVVGLAAPLIVPSIRQSMGYPTDNYYGLKSRCGELDYRYDTNVFSLENLFSRHSRFLCLARRRFENSISSRAESKNGTTSSSSNNDSIHDESFQAVPGEWIKTIGSGRAVRKEL